MIPILTDTARWVERAAAAMAEDIAEDERARTARELGLEMDEIVPLKDDE